MKLSRREFIEKAAIAAAAAGVLVGCGGPLPSATPEPTATPTPSPTPEPPYDPDVLTGEGRARDAKDSRIIGIMINNMSNTSRQNARPHRGIGEAKILIEIKVEGGITRFCALFDDVDDIPEIGPIRSGRDQFLQLILPWQAVYYHEGESVFCTRYIKDWEYWELNFGGMSYFKTPTQRNYSHRDKRGRDVATEHTLFTSGEEVQKAIDKADLDMTRAYKSTFFKFADYRYDEYVSLDGGEPATSVTIRHSSSYRTYFDYDAASQTYKMSMYSNATKQVSPTIDENTGNQLSFTNLVVLFTAMEAYPGDSHNIQDVDYDYGGVGYYFTNGRCEMIGWQKGSPGNVLILSDHNSQEDEMVTLNCGKTYLSFVDLKEAEHFSYDGQDDAASGDDLSDAEDVSDVTDADDADVSEDTAANITTD